MAIYIAIKNEPGHEGQWVFDNVDIDWIWWTGVITRLYRSLTGFYVYLPETVPNGGMQLVYKNSTLHDFWGYESNGMILNSPNHDISFTNNSLWFENMTIYNVNEGR